MNNSVVIGELTWPEYAAKVATGCPIFLPVGALEQHGHHMCMGAIFNSRKRAVPAPAETRNA